MEAVLAAVKVACGERILADVVALAHVVYLAVANVTDGCVAEVAVTLCMAQLERHAFRAVRSLLDLVSFVAGRTAIIVALKLGLFTDVVAFFLDVVSSSANVAANFGASIVRSPLSGLISKLQGLSSVTSDADNGHAIVQLLAKHWNPIYWLLNVLQNLLVHWLKDLLLLDLLCQWLSNLRFTFVFEAV